MWKRGHGGGARLESERNGVSMRAVTQTRNVQGSVQRGDGGTEDRGRAYLACGVRNAWGPGPVTSIVLGLLPIVRWGKEAGCHPWGSHHKCLFLVQFVFASRPRRSQAQISRMSLTHLPAKQVHRHQCSNPHISVLQDVHTPSFPSNLLSPQTLLRRHSLPRARHASCNRLSACIAPRTHDIGTQFGAPPP